MSSTLYFKRQVNEGKPLCDELKNIFKDKRFPLILDHRCIQYLEGLYDAGIVDVEKIIKIIQSGDKVELWLES